MKALHFLAFVACSAVVVFGAQDPSLSQEDMATYAVFLNYSAPALGESGVDNYVLRGFDGKGVRDVATFRFEISNAGERKTYVLVPVGKHDVTLRYHKVVKRVLANDSFDAEATFGVNLRPGLYCLHGERDNDFVFIWATRQDTGEIIAPRTKCLVIKGHGAENVFLPIPIK